MIRDATGDDLPDITRLFNAFILTTTIGWRDEVATPKEIAHWFGEQRAANFPVLVAEVDGSVVGYCCWSTFRGGRRFPGYRHTAELTIHVDQARHRSGIGSALLAALIERARASDLHVLIAGIDADNEPSIELHRSFGFAEVARMPETGRKFDRWLDLVLMQLIVS